MNSISERRWGITPLQIFLHNDEGYWLGGEPVPDDKESFQIDGRWFKPNYHAHIVSDWMEHQKQIQEVKQSYEAENRKQSEYIDKVLHYFPYVEKLMPMMRSAHSKKIKKEDLTLESMAFRITLGSDARKMSLWKRWDYLQA